MKFSIRNLTNVRYDVAKMPEVNRYWFRRNYWDDDQGKERHTVIILEKANNEEWELRVEDRKAGQSWQLLRMEIDGVARTVFERIVRGKSVVKSDIMSMGYLAGWVIEELHDVSQEMALRKMTSDGIEFLKQLLADIKKDKAERIEKLTASVSKTSISGLYKIISPTKGDARGSFREVVRFPDIELLTGYDFVGKQVNHSVSSYGTLRGLHVEPWAKLVTVISGLAMCVLLDCRPKSKTYGKTETVFLGFGETPDGQEIKGGAIFIEAGIANSFLVLSKKLDYSYVVDDLWTPGTAMYAVNPMDPTLAIPWTKYVPEDKIIRSDRDINSPSFEEFGKSVKF